jgi:ribosomal-protein-alanine N-acetyltransferase
VTPVELVPAERRHTEDWLRWRREPSSVAHNPLLDLSPSEIADRIARSGSNLSDRSHQEYRWIVEADGEPAGTVSVSGISWQMGYGEIGYQIAEVHQGRGVGKSAVRLLLDRAFAPGALRRVMATIAVYNDASRRLVTSLGFTEEGTLRQHFLVGGNAVDEVVYGLLAHEWSPDR